MFILNSGAVNITHKYKLLLSLCEVCKRLDETSLIRGVFSSWLSACWGLCPQREDGYNYIKNFKNEGICETTRAGWPCSARIRPYRSGFLENRKFWIRLLGFKLKTDLVWLPLFLKGGLLLKAKRKIFCRKQRMNGFLRYWTQIWILLHTQTDH